MRFIGIKTGLMKESFISKVLKKILGTLLDNIMSQLLKIDGNSICPTKAMMPML